MEFRLTRRDFLAASAAAAAGLGLAGRAQAAPWKTTLHKAMIGVPSEQVLKSWKAAGFEGMESTELAGVARTRRPPPARWPNRWA